MRPVELLYFEGLSPFHEPVFSFPILGRLSMRQMTIIGLSSIVSWLVYQSSESIMSMTILAVGAIFGFKKFNVISPESQITHSLRFLISRNHLSARNQKQLRRINKRSQKLSIPEKFIPKPHDDPKKIGIREVFTDPLKPIRLQIKLKAADGEPISNTKIRVDLDNTVVSTLSTDNSGEIEVLIIPQTLGQKRLVVFAEGHTIPVFEEILDIKNS